jgi:hypothetical protein
MNVNIISLKRFDEGLGHPIRLLRSHRREARDETDRLGKRDRVVSAVTAAVIREPFDRMRQSAIGKSTLNAFEHQISDHLAGDAAGRRDPRHHIPIAGIESEGDANAPAVPAGDLKAVRRPRQARTDRDDLTILSASRRLAGVAATAGRSATSVDRCVCSSDEFVRPVHAVD